ncbi:unnamed protein product [Mytilus coruscus]|uniref:C-type lectin domain-containing protein n=1 Tax=Mytilus coruscus TaxID=42192 RepID=A0A6J8CDP4_MYTCO|nr:unnamed protein product [Mytilus coruscus]
MLQVKTISGDARTYDHDDRHINGIILGKYAQIIQQSNNWIEANKECAIKRGGRLAKLDELHPSPCANKAMNVWLRNYDHERLTPWIAKIGCVTRDKSLREIRNSLLECYRSCKTTLFGYKKPWCSCEDETKTTFASTSISSCTSEERHENALWLFSKTEIDVFDDDYTMDCITAKCTRNGTIFRAVNCNSQRKAECRDPQGSEYFIDTQSKSEQSCKEKTSYLISNLKCLSNGISERNTEEVWTGIKRYRYNITESLTDLLNCVYVKCSMESDHVTLEHTENCRRQLDSFACIFNGTSENITTANLSKKRLNFVVKPSPVTSFPPAIMTLSESSSLHLEYLSTNVQQQLTTNIQIKSSASMQMQSNIGKFVLTTRETPELFSNHTKTNVAISSIITSFTSARTNNIDMSSTSYSSVVTNKRGTESRENKSTHSTTTMNLGHQYSTVNSSFGGMPVPAIISSSESSSLHLEDISTNVPPTSIVETSLWMQTQLNIESSILKTSVTPKLIFVHTSNHVALLTTISKSHMNSNIDMSTIVHSSVIKNTSGTESIESNTMHNTTTKNQNDNSRSQQLSTGLIVGISVSILCLVVLIIGIVGVCRLRNQQAFKEKSSLDFPIPIKPTNDQNYHDIDIDPKKETNVIENDPTHPLVTANDDDMPFRLTDKTSNGKTNKPNDAYAVVVKTPVTTKADNTSNGKTTKTNDAYAVVVKIPGKNQDKDEKTSLDIPESNYDSMNQPRPTSGNESGNIYDTYIGHLDEPTYNTTSHIQAREKKYESDYDRL